MSDKITELKEIRKYLLGTIEAAQAAGWKIVPLDALVPLDAHEGEPLCCCALGSIRPTVTTYPSASMCILEHVGTRDQRASIMWGFDGEGKASGMPWNMYTSLDDNGTEQPIEEYVQLGRDLRQMVGY